MKKLIIGLLMLTTLLTACSKEEAVTLNIIIASNKNIQNINTNYYKAWLEEQSGYTLNFIEISSVYSTNYIEEALSDENLNVDIILFESGTLLLPIIQQSQAWELKDLFLPLDDYVTEGTNMYKIFMDYKQYDWPSLLSDKDGKLYFLPHVNPSESAKNGQSLWINTTWLKNLDLPIPTTTQEFYEVLLAFGAKDPNGNGMLDEIALVGSLEHADTTSYNAIINAFVHYDASSYGFYQRDRALEFSPKDDAFREAAIYLNQLYEQELLHPLSFSLSAKGLSALATDPNDILGVFSASHLSDVFDESDANIFSNFTHLAPLHGNEQNAVQAAPVPNVGAAISKESNNKDQGFALLDLMLSEQAFLISMYGEENVDWEYAQDFDTDIFGEIAEIATINRLSGLMQNKNFNGAGALFMYPEYVDGVRYSNYDIGYFNARALLANEPYFDTESLELAFLKLSKDRDDIETSLTELSAYTEFWMQAFIKGEKDPVDDAVWKEYIEGYDRFSDLFDLLHAQLELE